MLLQSNIIYDMYKCSFNNYKLLDVTIDYNHLLNELFIPYCVLEIEHIF